MKALTRFFPNKLYKCYNKEWSCLWEVSYLLVQSSLVVLFYVVLVYCQLPFAVAIRVWIIMIINSGSSIIVIIINIIAAAAVVIIIIIIILRVEGCGYVRIRITCMSALWFLKQGACQDNRIHPTKSSKGSDWIR